MHDVLRITPMTRSIFERYENLGDRVLDFFMRDFLWSEYGRSAKTATSRFTTNALFARWGEAADLERIFPQGMHNNRDKDSSGQLADAEAYHSADEE